MDVTGSVTQVSRWVVETATVDQARWDAYSEAARGRSSPELSGERLDRSIEEQRADAMGAPIPLFRFFFGDREGNLWLSEYTDVGQAARTYYVVARDGRWLGSIQFPERFQPLFLGSDVILGVERDKLDVEAVAVYGIQKGDSNPPTP